MLNILWLTLKFIGLGYLGLIFHFLVHAQRTSSLFRKLINAAGALLLVGLPVWGVITLVTPTSPQRIMTTEPSGIRRIVERPQGIAEVAPPISAKVVGVVNGDTLEVQIDETTVARVQMLGMDAPESGMCFAQESTVAAVNLLQDQTVTLIADSFSPNRDKFGRLWRYVRLADGRLANQVMIEQGFAFEYTYYTAYEYQAEFRNAELQAQSQSLGIWTDKACSAASERPEHVLQTITWQMPGDLTPATVTRVVDGDTVEVNVAGVIERVRLIGIDTSESGRCYNVEATERQTTLTAGQAVLLEADPSQDDRDRFGRLLRYIWLPDGRNVNGILVAEGYAYEYTYREPYRYVEPFMQLEHEAHLSQLGLWAAITCDGLAGRRFSSAYDSN
jgi:micrococcal nuclease